MNLISTHIINQNSTAKAALGILSDLPDNTSLTLFVVDEKYCLKGTITDGDIRRGLLNDLELSSPISKFMNRNFKYIIRNDNYSKDFKKFRNQGLSLIPVLEDNGELFEIIDLKKRKASLPIAALLMAGGRGERLKPLTDTIPKPMLIIGNKPIIEHNLDRLINYGIKEFYISVRYLKDIIISYLGDGSSKGVSIKYIEEEDALGTIGALTLIDLHKYEDLLVMNSDILTNIDFEDFFTSYKNYGSLMTLASIPYNISIPYAVLNTENQYVANFEEKPSYTYYSNAGIYLLKASLSQNLPVGKYLDATDLMNLIINKSNKLLTHYPILGYWLDIGRHSDFSKAQDDFMHINFD
jgi:dTDP-glucose pyrophosphorylase